MGSMGKDVDCAAARGGRDAASAPRGKYRNKGRDGGGRHDTRKPCRPGNAAATKGAGVLFLAFAVDSSSGRVAGLLRQRWARSGYATIFRESLGVSGHRRSSGVSPPLMGQMTSQAAAAGKSGTCLACKLQAACCMLHAASDSWIAVQGAAHLSRCCKRQRARCAQWVPLSGIATGGSGVSADHARRAHVVVEVG